jgi:hypothetical protein
VQLKYFDFRSPHSYLGLLYSAVLLALPYELPKLAKKSLGTTR